MVNFYMLIGLPGAGKSYIASKMKDKNTVIISSDCLRKELYGDETIQENAAAVFQEMEKRAKCALSAGKNVVYDATNISRKRRKHLISVLRYPCNKIAVVVWAKYETCLQRDAIRNRTVGESVIKKMLLGFHPPFYDEGWDEIRFIINDTNYTRSDYKNWICCEHDNPHHNNSVEKHTRQVSLEILKKERAGELKGLPNTALYAAALLHDVGKKFVKEFKDSHGEPCEIAHFYNHHNVGSYFSIGYISIQPFTKRQRALIFWLVNVHMEPYFNSRYYRTLSPKMKHILDIFNECDKKGA